MRPPEPLAPTPRFLAALATFGLIFLGQPGLLCARGLGELALVALVPWAHFCSRPGPRAFLAEWAACALGVAAMTFWMRHLLPWLLIPMAILPGLWMAIGGIALRRAARRLPLALAAPAAWMLAEGLRWHLPAPLSFGWWRLGFLVHDSDWILGSARLWGTWGLTWVLAACGGWLADACRAGRVPGPRTNLAGLAPLMLAVVWSALPTPQAVDGPRLMLVQPGIEQHLKGAREDPFQGKYVDAVELTREGLAAAGSEPPDLVCWGETMFPWTLVGPGVLAAQRAGVGWLPFIDPPGEEQLLGHQRVTRALLQGVLFGTPAGTRALNDDLGSRIANKADVPWLTAALEGRRLLPEGTSFLTGIREWIVHPDGLRSRNAAACFSAAGELLGTASKVHLVPAAESSTLYSSVPVLVDAVRSVGGFVPDFVSPGEAGVLPLATRAGEHYRVGLSICYDNAFDDPYRGPLATGEVDFFLILSNEAWYGESVLMDHMLALTRLIAASTGRSVVRATNSGVSAVVGPDGQVLDLIEGPGGRRKMVRGVLNRVVPVPAPGEGLRTPWVVTGGWQPWGWFVLALLLSIFGGWGVTPWRASGTVRGERLAG